MAIDWSTVGRDVENAVVGVLGANFQVVRRAAQAQIAALVSTGQSIEAEKDEMTALEYQSLEDANRGALAGVLHTIEGITIVVAEQAAAAAWQVVASALKASLGLPFIP